MKVTIRRVFAVSLFTAALLLPLYCLAQATTQANVKPPTAAPKPVPASRPAMDPGERAFNANCIRCHQPPESLNPRIVPTVIRHMRLRANLSAQDEHDILHYLNP